MLTQFFTLWGLRFDQECLGSTCGSVQVERDGEPVADHSAVRLASAAVITVTTRS